MYAYSAVGIGRKNIIIYSDWTYDLNMRCIPDIKCAYLIHPEQHNIAFTDLSITGLVCVSLWGEYVSETRGSRF